MDFKYDVKDNYTAEDMEKVLNQHYTFVKGAVKQKETVKWDSKVADLTADLAAAKEAKEAIAAQVEELTKERDDLNAQVTTLTDEVTPMRETTLVTKFAGVSGELVQESAIHDSLKEAGVELKDTVEEAKAKLEALVESKPYLKKSTVVSDDKALLLKKQEEAKKQKFANDKNVIGGIAR